jgi:hypothetical protein
VVVHALATPSGGSDLIVAVRARRSRERCGLELAVWGPPHPKRSVGDPLSHGAMWPWHLRGAEEPASPGRYAQATGEYDMFCPINSSAHLAILPSASGFWMTSPSGYLDTTVMGCASK